VVKLNSTGFKLSTHQWPKRSFNPHSAEDLALYQDFLLNDRWGNGCPFNIEWPFLNVLDTINHKIVYQHINSLITKNKKAK
jgi:hypothetical protein